MINRLGRYLQDRPVLRPFRRWDRRIYSFPPDRAPWIAHMGWGDVVWDHEVVLVMVFVPDPPLVIWRGIYKRAQIARAIAEFLVKADDPAGIREFLDLVEDE